MLKNSSSATMILKSLKSLPLAFTTITSSGRFPDATDKNKQTLVANLSFRSIFFDHLVVRVDDDDDDDEGSNFEGDDTGEAATDVGGADTDGDVSEFIVVVVVVVGVLPA